MRGKASQLRLLSRLLTYMRPMKYPAAAKAAIRTITIRTPIAGELLRIGAAITATIEQYISNGNRCRSIPDRAIAHCQAADPQVPEVGCLGLRAVAGHPTDIGVRAGS